MWSKKNEFCTSCKSTYYKHAGMGLCSNCYRVNATKRKLAVEIDSLSTQKLFELKRPDLHHSYWSINDREQIKEALLNQEEQKLYYLKWYGQLETQNEDLDLLRFEKLFNELAYKFGKGRYFYIQKLHHLHSSLNNEQLRDLAMMLLKLKI